MHCLDTSSSKADEPLAPASFDTNSYIIKILQCYPEGKARSIRRQLGGQGDDMCKWARSACRPRTQFSELINTTVS